MVTLLDHPGWFYIFPDAVGQNNIFPDVSLLHLLLSPRLLYHFLLVLIVGEDHPGRCEPYITTMLSVTFSLMTLSLVCQVKEVSSCQQVARSFNIEDCYYYLYPSLPYNHHRYHHQVSSKRFKNNTATTSCSAFHLHCDQRLMASSNQEDILPVNCAVPVFGLTV